MSDTEAQTMRLGLTSIRSAVKRKFAAAQTSGDLIFSETEVTLLRTKHGLTIIRGQAPENPIYLQFQLRYCPALGKKPTDDKGATPAKKTKFDPFEDPSVELLVARIPAANHKYNLVLNKYPVIPNHFILATKVNLPQTDLLDPEDLATAYACLRAWRDDHSSDPTEDNDLFAFFNSGPDSGASQPHRHIQFLPVGNMKHGLTPEDALPWQPLMKDLRVPHPLASRLPQALKYDPRLPFLMLNTPLSDGLASPSKLYERYLFLLRAARVLSQTPSIASSDEPIDLSSIDITNPPESKHVSFSYNLALTLKHMAICPRRSETTDIPGLEAGKHQVALNGTVLGGTMMVKHAEEWETLKNMNGTEELEEMLSKIGFPPTSTSDDERSGKL
ncbi:5',5'''-P-1,P-4-tetraphosphate phosphorylase 2 [Cyphellophora attinorum]|uniref:5',5'''-P-1,P-4-tetraphosphate phosphorylase 2 n=1 Tax=Cyphellophora attinorum TaxID=1664694 RepID=A0A0N1NWK7_9EURO|nr:5',5'''-P-1,P-4-tetraphosphate phosphorylase 2 [Phialophora attinorum]KPI36152.1 5',5'''-P-1,P-4-tetraphosphate phosphorylase 2 [Phialophora attinorum]